MKTTKLVIGIISIILSVIVGFQSMIAGLGNSLAENGEAGGSGGFFLGIILLVSGIVAIATRKGGKGGLVAGGFYIFGSFIGFVTAGSYSDLNIWAFLALAFGLTFIIGDIRSNKKQKEINHASQETEEQLSPQDKYIKN